MKFNLKILYARKELKNEITLNSLKKILNKNFNSNKCISY